MQVRFGMDYKVTPKLFKNEPDFTNELEQLLKSDSEVKTGMNRISDDYRLLFDEKLGSTSQGGYTYYSVELLKKGAEGTDNSNKALNFKDGEYTQQALVSRIMHLKGRQLKIFPKDMGPESVKSFLLRALQYFQSVTNQDAQIKSNNNVEQPSQ